MHGPARCLGGLALLALTGGCVGGPVGLALAGASALATAAGGGGAGARPGRLVIDPNRDLSETLAGAGRGASAACRAVLARLEGEAAGETGAGGGGGDAAEEPAVERPAPSPRCEVRPVCLGGSDTPIMVNLCEASAASPAAAQTNALSERPTITATPGGRTALSGKGTGTGTEKPGPWGWTARRGNKDTIAR